MLDERFYISHGPLSLSDIIEGLKAELLDPKFYDELITHAAPCRGAKVGSVTFLNSKKDLSNLSECKATACFVSDTFAKDVGQEHIIPIITDTPRAHFSRAITKLTSRRELGKSEGAAQIAKTANIHASAIIGAGAIIKSGVRIGPNVVIGPGVVIGEHSQIQAGAVIECAVLGSHCNVKPNAVIGGRGFGVDSDEAGLVDIAHIGCVLIGDRVQIGANSCVDRGQIGNTVLGNDVKLDNQVQIAHNVHIGDGCRIAAQTGISGSCHIGSHVFMGGAVGLADHITVGDNARIAARSGVMHNIPAGEVWSGLPAQPIRDHMRLVAVTRKLAAKRGKKKADTNDA